MPSKDLVHHLLHPQDSSPPGMPSKDLVHLLHPQFMQAYVAHMEQNASHALLPFYNFIAKVEMAGSTQESLYLLIVDNPMMCQKQQNMHIAEKYFLKVLVKVSRGFVLVVLVYVVRRNSAC